MATLKEQLIDKIKSNTYFQQICLFEVETDDGSNDDSEGGTSGGNNGDSEGGTSGGITEPVTFDETDSNLQYYTYAVDEENKTVEVTSVNYSTWYANNGNYDVVIPATLGNYPTVINVEEV